MRADFIVDYAGYTAFKLISWPVRFVRPEVVLFFGRILGQVMYAVDYKHRRQAYVNVRSAFAGELTPRQACALVRGFYLNFGQSLVEIFLIPVIDQRYIDTYVTIEGRHHIEAAFKKGKGVLLVGVHEGSWELSNVICANLGFAFHLFVRDQRHPRMDALLNDYRRQKGCRIIHRQNDTRALIQILKNNEAVGMTADQGGRTGVGVDFFGRRASMPSGAIRLALKYDAVILPSYYTRVHGPYHKIIIQSPFDLEKTADFERDVTVGVARLTAMFEGVIARYPKDYFWTYKIWKYSRQRTIVILSDGKAGHLHQSQAAERLVAGCLADQGITARTATVDVVFKNRISKLAMGLSSCLSGRYSCSGCLWCLEAFLSPQTYASLVKAHPDIVISCGSSLAPVNCVLSREAMAKSIVIMRPSLSGGGCPDLAIVSKHDRPKARKNTVVIDGALNLVTDEYLRERGETLRQSIANGKCTPGAYIGLLLGGNAKGYVLSRDVAASVLRHIQSVARQCDARIVATTSRRTPQAVEQLIRCELTGDPRCDLAVIANETNVPYAVGGILCVSQIIVVSPESISMISEAASSGKHIVVFTGDLDRRHAAFLNHMASKKYISIAKPDEIERVIKRLLQDHTAPTRLDDTRTVAVALERIL